jgi:putative transposase
MGPWADGKRRQRPFSLEKLSPVVVRRSTILVHAADIQDRDGAVDVLKAARFRFPWLRHVFADGGYGQMDPRNYQAIRYRKGLQTPASSVGRRGDIRLARSMPEACKGLGNIHRILNRSGTDRVDPHAHATNRKVLLRLRNF